MTGAGTPARFFGFLVSFADLANPLPRDAETVANVGQRVLAAVGPP